MKILISFLLCFFICLFGVILYSEHVEIISLKKSMEILEEEKQFTEERYSKLIIRISEIDNINNKINYLASQTQLIQQLQLQVQELESKQTNQQPVSKPKFEKIVK